MFTEIYFLPINSMIKELIIKKFYIDYKTIYEKTYKLILLSISNENAIFEYINKFEQKLFSKIILLRIFIR